MSRSRTQKLAALFALVWIFGQPTTRSALLAGVLSLGHGDDGHTHSLAFAADAGHVDLVASHAHEEECERSRARSGPEAASRPDFACCRASDHVVHLAVDAAARETAQAHLIGLQRPASSIPSRAENFASLARPAHLPSVTELLRTVVLRT